MPRAILDSSPVPSPRPLKRSASIASLPTPPRTHHKRTRSRGSAAEADSDTEEGSSEEGGLDDGRLSLGSKKRRIAPKRSGQEIEEEENEFWRSGGKSTSGGRKARSHSPSTSVSPARVLYRIAHKAPVSPPPSRRQTRVHTPPPVTPKARTSRVGASRVRDLFDPVRDTPNNPFIAGSPLSPEAASSEEPHTPSPRVEVPEKPTVTYVLYVPPPPFSMSPLLMSNTLAVA
jgi:hypothetical protein